MLYYHVDNNLKKAQDVDGNLDKFIMNYLYEPIDDDKDWVVTVSLLIRRNW